jgi:D-serine deaminase-like pyridoxal phosphate-dependent protein
MPFPDIATPTLLLNPTICRHNINRMTEKARSFALHFRPHFKTHQSRHIALWFREVGVSAITVSSARMARYFADDGWNDITIAFPFNLREAAFIDQLASEICLNVLVEAPRVVRRIDDALDHTVGTFIKIDTGYGRTGISYVNKDAIRHIIAEIESSRHLEFRGLLTHGGDTYHAANQEDIRRRFDISRKRLVDAALPFRADHPNMVVSAGDTPGCSLSTDFTGLDEIRPGNFVFYDAMQLQLGSCAAEEIGVAVACPIVALHPERNEAVLFGGGVHLSRESVSTPDGASHYGLAALLTEDGWSEPLPETRVHALSQEHGILRTTAEILSLLREGMLIAVLPVHSCLTAESMRGYLSLDGSPIDHMAGISYSHSLNTRRA